MSKQKRAIYKAAGFDLELLSCKRVHDSASSMKCEFIITIADKDAAVQYNVNYGIGTRAFLDTKELRGSFGELGANRNATYVRASIPANISAKGNVLFKGVPDQGNTLSLLRIVIYVHAWHNVDFRNVTIQ